MAQLFTDNAFSTLASSIGSGVTSIPLATGEGARFPSPTGGDYFDLTLTQAGSETQWEIVRCTARSGDTLTVTRGQEGTAALAWAAGDKSEIRITATWLNDPVGRFVNTFTAPQRGTITTDNDGSFDQNVTNKFKCTPTGAVALTFTNHTAGQGGTVIFNNTTNYAITAAATTYIAAADLTKLSATGYYLIGYEDDGTNAYCTVSAKMTSAGA